MQLQGINTPEKVFIGFLSVVTLMALLIPLLFFINPQKQRALQFDQQRIDRILSVSYEINNVYQESGVLPRDLTFLTNKTSATDPETGGELEYFTTGVTGYKLCATFALDSNEDTSLQYKTAPNIVGDISMKTSLAHKAGYDCIDFPVNPRVVIPTEIYPN